MAYRKSQNLRPEIVFLMGPTAAGKTDTAVYLAEKLNSEIVSCDSMQIYKDMDIMTSKPVGCVLKKTRHHLIGVVSPENEYNVSKYRLDALRAIKKIIKRGKVPLFVGGTGLYMTILLDGIFNLKVKSQKMRERLYKQAEKSGSAYLHKKLQKIDPDAAAKIHPNDLKRIIRALEVYEVTGKPISMLQKNRHGLWDEYGVKIFCLDMERGKLYNRIDSRVEKMFKKGLIKEAKRLLNMKLSRTASAAIGLKEVKGYLEGSYGLQETKELMKRNTRQYAKKQLTWFRKDKRIQWINVAQNDTPAKITERIWKGINGKSASRNG
ncbi:MAG: tRNA (adenosine(37)-N6)-dimethylallyltransferase MiaA [Candidatus Omnitrophota bacterium]|jgi:tRNA dimethylallyltransferase